MTCSFRGFPKHAIAKKEPELAKGPHGTDQPCTPPLDSDEGPSCKLHIHKLKLAHNRTKMCTQDMLKSAHKTYTNVHIKHKPFNSLHMRDARNRHVRSGKRIVYDWLYTLYIYI